MKKVILTVLTILMLVIPAYAAEGDAATEIGRASCRERV